MNYRELAKKWAEKEGLAVVDGIGYTTVGRDPPHDCVMKAYEGGFDFFGGPKQLLSWSQFVNSAEVLWSSHKFPEDMKVEVSKYEIRAGYKYGNEWRVVCLGNDDESMRDSKEYNRRAKMIIEAYEAINGVKL